MAVLQEVKSNYGKLDFLIDGEWIKSSSDKINTVTNPATNEVIAEFSPATKDEARDAVQASYNAFKSWKDYPTRDRARLLFDLRAKFEENFDMLTRVLTQDHGRTIKESIGSVRRVIENIESACSALYGLPKQNEHLNQLANGIDQVMMWEPLGPFLIVTPGNIPMHAWSSFVPYALAAGCTVVVSPSQQAPVAAEMVCRISEEVGFPKGVINLVHGGRNINEYILEQKEIKGVGFIGSNRAGWELFAQCGRLGKTSSINGNGKNHVVIMPDAKLEEAVPWLLRACFGMTGQRCLGVDNVVVVGDIYEKLKDMFLDQAKGMRLGYGLDEASDLGPFTTYQGRQKVYEWVELALKDGAKMLMDGRNVSVPDYPNGYFMGPTIFEGVHVDMPSAKEEAFGPVASLIHADDLDQVIEWINTKTNLGHSANIMTTSGINARKFVQEVNVGNVGINVGVSQPYAFFPLGSRRESFVGTAKSRMASMRMFMDEKTVTARWV